MSKIKFSQVESIISYFSTVYFFVEKMLWLKSNCCCWCCLNNNNKNGLISTLRSEFCYRLESLESRLWPQAKRWLDLTWLWYHSSNLRKLKWYRVEPVARISPEEANWTNEPRKQPTNYTFRDKKVIF